MLWVKMASSGKRIPLDPVPSEKGNILLTSHDHELISSVATRLIEFTEKGMIDSFANYDEYLNDSEIKAKQDKIYAGLTFA